MKVSLRIVLLSVLALAVLQRVAATCTNTCSGGAGESCMFCSGPCGACANVGVVAKCTAPGTVHFSFDDGPNQYFEQVLDLLDARNIKASFWIIGSNVKGYESLLLRAYNSGHFIGDHTWTHPSLNTISIAQVKDELTKCKTVLESTLPGLKITHMRPPYGDMNTPVREAAISLGMTPVVWNMDSQDWLGVPDWIHGNVTTGMSGYSIGAMSHIILSHPNNAQAVATLPWMLDYVMNSGYRVVSFEECIDPNAVMDPSLTKGKPNLAECVHPVWDQAYDLKCGNGVSCAQPDDGIDTCCSAAGYCGSGPAYCGSGCIDGACDTCVNAGYVSYVGSGPGTATGASTGGGNGHGGSGGHTGGGDNGHGTGSASGGSSSASSTGVAAATSSGSGTGTVVASSTGSMSSTGAAAAASSSGLATPSSSTGVSSPSTTSSSTGATTRPILDSPAARASSAGFTLTAGVTLAVVLAAWAMI